MDNPVRLRYRNRYGRFVSASRAKRLKHVITELVDKTGKRVYRRRHGFYKSLSFPKPKPKPKPKKKVYKTYKPKPKSKRRGYVPPTIPWKPAKAVTPVAPSYDDEDEEEPEERVEDIGYDDEAESAGIPDWQLAKDQSTWESEYADDWSELDYLDDINDYPEDEDWYES